MQKMLAGWVGIYAPMHHNWQPHLVASGGWWVVRWQLWAKSFAQKGIGTSWNRMHSGIKKMNAIRKRKRVLQYTVVVWTKL